MRSDRYVAFLVLSVAIGVCGCRAVVNGFGPGGGPGGPGGPNGPDGGLTAFFPPDGGDPIASLVYSCDPSLTPGELGLPRLTKVQLRNTLQLDIKLADATDSAAIWAQVSPTFDTQYVAEIRTAAPGDVNGGFSRTDQAIQQNQIDTMYAVGQAIGQQLTSTTARMTTVLGSCATSHTNDATCLQNFIAKWGSRVLRYPLTSNDVAFYADIADAGSGSNVSLLDPAAVSDVIAALINAPESLYRVEHGTDTTNAVSPLSAFELASRLSFQFWQAPPDDTLWNLAADGGLNNPTVYAQQVNRLIHSPNAYSGLDEFVSEWLRIVELPQMNALNSDPAFSAFAGTQLPTATTAQGMINDVLAAARQAVNDGGTPTDFLRDNHSYATDPYVAGIYGVTPWDGVSAAPTPASAARTGGLLTRPAMLSTGTSTTRPIHKGFQVRNALLCQKMGPPPPNVNKVVPPSSGAQTTRDVITQLTSNSPCSGCHTTTINPPGFITENFDALGRDRTQENVFDTNGNVVATLPIDTSAIPQVVPGDQRTMTEASQVVDAMDHSGLYDSCVALRYFRFTYERNEASDNSDGCALSDLEQAVRGGASFADVLSHLVESPAFKQKRFQ